MRDIIDRAVRRKREEKDEAGHKIYVFVLEDWRIEELKEYVKEQQDRNYF